MKPYSMAAFVVAVLMFVAAPAFAMSGNVLWLPFDNNLTDISGNGLDGTAQGDATIISDCKFGSCLSVDGDGDYVNVSNNAVMDFGTGDFSVDYWVNINYAGATFGKVYPDSNAVAGYFVELYGENSMDFQICGDYGIYTDEVTIPSGWHHVVVERNGLTAYVYIDGQLQTSQNETDYDNVTNDGDLTIGMSTEAGNFFDGKIDEFRLWNRALNEAEINNLMNYNSLDAPPPPPPTAAQVFKPIILLVVAAAICMFVYNRLKEGDLEVKAMISLLIGTAIAISTLIVIGMMIP